MAIDLKSVQEKWQQKWEKDKVFHVATDKRKKYYIAIVYPYMNGLLHLGHLFTYTFSEVLARYKRMQNFNVLVKFGFHCTGTPIVAAANRIKENDPQQINILKQMGISEKEIPKFADPEYWITYFPEQTLIDLKKMGFAIDERHTFITTSLNKPYDAMVRWQFNKLKALNYVKKGKHPVVWCPKCNEPTGDHARSEGEGETPQEFTILKFKMKDGSFIVAATLRPETVFGQTNMWVDSNVEYVKTKVDNEIWIVSKECIPKLKSQGKKVEIFDKIKGKSLLGQYCLAPGIEKEIIILPSDFCNPDKGTGLVTGVPSHAPFDWIGLTDLQNNPELTKKYGLHHEEISKIKPISLISIEGYGEHPGVEICKQRNIKSQKEHDKLEQAKKDIYKLEHHAGIMKKVAGKYAGMKVEEAKTKIKKDLIAQNKADVFYELTGKVVCRCGTTCIVNIVSDQWFIEYNNEDWKKQTHAALDNMQLLPEKVRKQFDFVIDWLDHWACTREFGLGTKLPWDEKWLIESLSDSTIQMAYNTISKYLEHPKDYGFSVDKINDYFFDYVFLGKGSLENVEKTTKIKKEMINQMKHDFEYWYPFDFRNSAKDLLQNHLAFCVFNHVALFPEKHWPKAFMINGRIMVNNEKMSKSKGNFFTMRELYEKYSADIVRLTSANAGEGMDDANFDMTFLETAQKKLTDFHQFCKENYNKGRNERLTIDTWFESSIYECIKKTTECLEEVKLKSAVKAAFLDMHRHLDWYLRRTNGNPNKDLTNFYIESQIKMLSPFTPHFSEELWEQIGKKGYISNEQWPVYDDKKIDQNANQCEALITSLIEDVRQVIKLAKIESPKITLIVAPQWKYDLFKTVTKLLKEEKSMKEILSTILKDEKLKKYGQDINKFLPKLILARRTPTNVTSQKVEYQALKEAQNFLEKEFNTKMVVVKAEESKEQKANQAMPGKPSIVVI